jgi:hypothetical protein
METIDREILEELREAGSVGRRKAAEKRQRIVAEAREATQREYRGLLTKIVGGESVPPKETAALLASLGKSLDSLPIDLEDREAELADEVEVKRVASEKQAIEAKIGDAEAKVEKLTGVQDDADATAADLESTIRQEELKVAVPQRKRLRAVSQQRATAADALGEAKAEVDQLRQQLAAVKPSANHLAEARGRRESERMAAKWRAKSAESDRAMEVFRFAQQQDELPDDRMAAAINPKAPSPPPTQQLGGQRVRVGQLNGREVTIAVGKLG